MTPHDIYRAALAFVDQTEGLPAEVRVRMIRSYLRILAEPEDECVPACVHTSTDEIALRLPA